MVNSNLIFIIFQLFFAAGAEDNCDRERKNYRYTDSNFRMSSIEYLTTENPESLILYLPPTGGTTPLDTNTAKYFCENGLSTIILNSWTGYINKYSVENFSEHQAELDAAKKALLGLSNNVYKNKKIAIFGLSKGAIGVTAFKSELKSNIKSMFLVVPGSPLHLTISRAGARVLKEIRDLRLEAFSIDQLTYDRMIFDSLLYKTQKPSKSIKLAMVISNNDTTVPSVLQRNLVDRWKPNRLWTSEVGHRRTIIDTHLRLTDDAVKFFKSSF